MNPGQYNTGKPFTFFTPVDSRTGHFNYNRQLFNPRTNSFHPRGRFVQSHNPNQRQTFGQINTDHRNKCEHKPAFPYPSVSLKPALAGRNQNARARQGQDQSIKINASGVEFVYKCPGCKQPFGYKSNHPTRNAPRTLACHHALCEECIRNSIRNTNEVQCYVCSDRTVFHKDTVFGFNHYIIGHILCSKSDHYSQLKNTNVKLTPPGIQCQTDQQALASYELFRCAEHKKMLRDVYCGTCSVDCCCYCFLEKHDGHERFFLTHLSDEEEIELKRTSDVAKHKLKLLEIAQKKVEKLDEVMIDDVEEKIGVEFAYLHSKLHLVEKKIRSQARKLKRSKVQHEISEEIQNSIKKIKNLLSHLNQREKIEIDMKKLLNNLREVENMSTDLVFNKDGNTLDCVEFHVDEQIKDLEKFFKLEIKDTLPISLVVNHDVHMPLIATDNCDFSDETQAPTPSFTCSNSNDVHSCSSSISTSTSNHPKKQASATSTVSEPIVKRPKKQVDGSNSVFIPRQGIAGTAAKVIITRLSSINSFYVRFKNSEGEFKKLLQEIEHHISSKKSSANKLKSVEINELYLAPYDSEKDQWGRALVIQKKGNEMYSVHFIDYGTDATIVIDQFSHISWNLAQQPGFAVECVLDRLGENDADDNSAVELVKNLEGTEALMTTKAIVNGVHKVDLYIQTPLDFHSAVDLLINGCGALKGDKNHPQDVEKTHIFESSDTFVRGSSYEVYIRHVENPWKLYAQSVANEKFLLDLLESLEKHYKNSYCDLHYPIENTDIVVRHQSANFGDWHRARVLKVNLEEKTAKVYLLDWGKNVHVNWSDVRMLASKFKRIECLVVSMKLADINPLFYTDWSEEDTAEAKSFLEEYSSRTRPMNILVSNTKPLEVILFEELGAKKININALMVEKELAKSAGKLSETRDWLVKPKKDETEEETGILPIYIISSDDEQDESDHNYSSESKFQVEIVRFENPNSIFIAYHIKSNKLEEMQKDLQIHYKTTKKDSKKSWNVSDRTVVFNAKDKLYYRGVIKKIQQKNYEIYLYDQDETIVVGREHLRKMHSFFVSPPRVFKVHLAKIKPAGGSDKWSETSLEWFRKLFKKHKNIFVEIIGKGSDRKSTPVTMWYMKIIEKGALEPLEYRYTSIDQKAIRAGLALRKLIESEPETNNSSDAAMSVDVDETSEIEIVEDFEVVEVIEDDEDKHVEVDDKITAWPLPLPIRETFFNAIITCAEIEGYLYVRNEKHKEDYELLETKMAKYFNENSEWKPFEIRKKSVVTIRYENLWYRGVVLELINESTAKVFMIDFGSDHLVPINTLYQTVMFAEVPPLVSKIKLYDVHSRTLSWTDADIGCLLEIAPDNAKIIIRSGLSVPIPEADVYYLDGTCINDKLVSLCRNLQRKKSKMGFVYTRLPKHDKGQKIELEITAVLDYKMVSLQVEDDDYAKFVEEFSELYSDIQREAPSLEPLLDVENGSPCICQYSEDKNWYRAKILSISDDFATVIYVDYGNFEQIMIKDLKSIKYDWLSIPVQYHEAEISYTVTDEKFKKVLTSRMVHLIGKTKNIEIVKNSPLSIHIYGDNDELYYNDDLILGCVKITN